MEKLTAWLPGTSKPIRAGVYQRNYRAAVSNDKSIGVAYCYWDGKRWSLYDSTPEGAKRGQGLYSMHQKLPWRGLVAKGGAA